jgi:putative aldouronate transport system permease protein
MRRSTSFSKSKYIWIMILPGMLYYVIFSYIPLYGIQIAFKEYAYNKGIWGSPWVGFDNFKLLFQYHDFWIAVRNTLIISLGRIIIQFPVPIIVAALLNEMGRSVFKHIYQTIYTFPYFISWIVAFGIFFNLLSSEGIVNQILHVLGFHEVRFFTSPSAFLPLIFASDLWKTMGWNVIIFLAAIAGINPETYEAATVDGANRFQRMIHIVWPGILPTTTILLVLQIGNSMNAGFDQILNMYSSTVYSVSDIIDTYIYRMGFQGSGSFSISAAAGLFKSVINLTLLLLADRIVRWFGQQGIWR